MRPIVLLLALLLASPAHPGAWPREPGKAFLSLKTEFDEAESRTSYFGEYGLTPRVTIGGQIADARRDSQTLMAVRRASVFARYALGDLTATNRFAVSFGVSAPVEAASFAEELRLETALHWGRGFQSRWGSGWVTASAKLMVESGEERPMSDLSALVGLNPRENWMVMLAASHYADSAGSSVKLTPSIGYRPHPDVWIVPSLTSTLSGPSETSLGLALWLSF